MPGQTRGPLLVVRIGDGVGQPGLAAGLDQALQISVGDRRRRLRAQIDILGLAGDDDRPGLSAVKGACLTAIRRCPGRVLIAQADVQGQAVGDFEVVLYEHLPGRVQPRRCPTDSRAPRSQATPTPSRRRRRLCGWH